MSLAQKIFYFILMVALFVVLGSIFIKSIELTIYLSLSVTLLLFPLLFGKWKLELASPIVITFIYLILAYPSKFIAFRLGMPYLKEEFPNTLWNDNLMSSLFLGLTIGVISFLIAFYSTPNFILNYFRKLKFKYYVNFDIKLPRKIFIIYIIGVLSFLIQIYIGFYTSFAAEGINYDTRFNVIFANTSEYVWYGLIAGFLWITSKQKVKSQFGNFLFFGMLFFSFLMGIFFLASKTYLIYPILFFVLAISINKVRIKIPLLISVFIAVLFFTFLFVPQYRDNFKKTYGDRPVNIEEYIANGNATLLDITSTKPDMYYVSSSIIHRFSGIDITSIIFKNVPYRYEYYYFEQLGSIFYSLIPRFIYPAKPTQDKADYFDVEIAGMYWGGSAAPTPLGEGFLNLGYIGITLLFGLWGLLQSILYNGIYLPRKNNFIIQVIYVVVMLALIGFGTWIVIYVASILQVIVFLIPLILILRSK